jgi:hypothetical protein
MKNYHYHPIFHSKPLRVIKHTLIQTTQLVKSKIYYVMRHQMLRHNRSNKSKASGTYFANEKSIEGYHCAQVFFGINPKMLYFAGVKS